MLAYIVRRLFLIIPTLLGIMIINFVIVQLAPGGPVEQMIAELRGEAVGATERFSGGGADVNQEVQPSGGERGSNTTYRGAQGLDPEVIAEIERMFGFDKPLHERFLLMMGNYIQFDFGESYFRDRRVVDLVLEKMPVSISIGCGQPFLSILSRSLWGWPRRHGTGAVSTSGPAVWLSSAMRCRLSSLPYF